MINLVWVSSTLSMVAFAAASMSCHSLDGDAGSDRSGPQVCLQNLSLPVYYESFQNASDPADVGFSVAAGHTEAVAVARHPLRHSLADDQGLVLGGGGSHYQLHRELEQPLRVGDGQPLVFQFELWHRDGSQCGRFFMKLLLAVEKQAPRSFFAFASLLPRFQKPSTSRDASLFANYAIMFGTSKCPAGTDEVRLTIRHQHAKTKEWEEKHLVNAPPTPTDASVPHLYTLVLSGDGQSYTLRVDGEDVRTGSLLEDFSPAFQPPKTIKDPSQSKPADWVDDEMIPDPKATQPEEWDEEEDGEWEPPQIQNPAYQGSWVHRMVANPDFYEVEAPGHLPAIGAVAIDTWTLSRDTSFDNLLLSRSGADAEALTAVWRGKVARIKEAGRRSPSWRIARALAIPVSILLLFWLLPNGCYNLPVCTRGAQWCMRARTSLSGWMGLASLAAGQKRPRGKAVLRRKRTSKLLHRGYIQLPQGLPMQLAIVQGSIADGIQHRDVVMFGTNARVSEGPVPRAVRRAWQAKNSDAWKTAFKRGHRISSHRVAATFKYDAPGARGANRTFWAVAINPPHADASTGRAQGDDLQTAVADGLRQVLPQVTPGAAISIATVALGTGNFKWSVGESVAEVVRGLQDPSLAGLVGPHCELVVYAFSAAMGQAASSWYSAIQSGNVVPLLASGSATAVLPAPAAAAAGWGRAATTAVAAAAGPPGVTPGGFFAIDASLGDHVSPAWWQTRCNGGKYPARRMVAVPSGTAEYRAVAAALHATLPRRQLIRVERNENMAAWAMFVQRQRTVLNLPNRTSPNELHMWHGTSGTDPDLILQNGVDPRRARDSGFYGRGGYHALAAAYSDGGYAHTNGQQEKVLILCRVTRGRSKDVQDALEQHTVEPPGYDSVQSTRNTANRWPGTFNCIVYAREHSYPEYKVVYSATDE